jgi:arylsulfatase A-like enzyme
MGGDPAAELSALPGDGRSLAIVMGRTFSRAASHSGRRGARLGAFTFAAGVLATFGVGCAAPTPETRPSLLLVVVDTLRADAVSAYGAVAGTTPAIDALAAGGVRYTHAYAPAPWTIPSHASLFTGLGVERHRVGIGNRMTAAPELVMLAERLRDAGYDTAAFVENSLVGEPFGLMQGFEHAAVQPLTQGLAEIARAGSSTFDALASLDAWARDRDAGRPFFVFVNLIDAHEPYLVRPPNRFLPPGVDDARAAEVARAQSPMRICDAIPPADELAILHGLYLGDVAAADAKVGAIHRRVEAAAGAQPLVTIVTADHGEHLGEHRLLDHNYTVREAALRIPLVVAGLPDTAPAVVDTPVTLTDVTASVLSWAAVDVTDRLDGRPLPVAPGALPAPRDLLTAYSDSDAMRDDWPLDGKIPGPTPARKRQHCGAEDRVFGDMAALIRYPHKLIWYSRNAPQLFDVAQDPQERADLIGERPDVAQALQAELAARLARSRPFVRADDAAVDPRAREALRALGYAE